MALVVGSANIDLFLIVDNFPKEGETITSKNSFIKFGGKGANQAVALAKLNTQTMFCGCVGDDEYGNKILNAMKNDYGVDISKVLLLSDKQTGQAIITINNNKENNIILIGGANQQQFKVLPQQFIEAIQNCQFILLQKEIPFEVNLLVAQEAKKMGKQICLDCGGNNYKLQQLLQYINILSPNQTELEYLLEKQFKDEQQMIEQIRNKILQGQIYLVKLGSSGSIVITQKEYVKISAVTQLNPQILKDYEIQDTTGAGDCFTSAFMCKYMQLLQQNFQKMFHHSLIFANSAAFLTITKQGAMNSMPTKEEVEDFIQKYNLYQ